MKASRQIVLHLSDGDFARLNALITKSEAEYPVEVIADALQLYEAYLAKIPADMATLPAENKALQKKLWAMNNLISTFVDGAGTMPLDNLLNRAGEIVRNGD